MNTSDLHSLRENPYKGEAAVTEKNRETEEEDCSARRDSDTVLMQTHVPFEENLSEHICRAEAERSLKSNTGQEKGTELTSRKVS